MLVSVTAQAENILLDTTSLLAVNADERLSNSVTIPLGRHVKLDAL